MKEYLEFNKLPYYSTTYFEQAKNSGTWYSQCDKPYKPEDFTPNENIDRIKLPCFCTFEHRGKRKMGIIINNKYRRWGKDEKLSAFALHAVATQTDKNVGSIVEWKTSLKELIRDYKINIGKVEINYYEVI